MKWETLVWSSAPEYRPTGGMVAIYVYNTEAEARDKAASINADRARINAVFPRDASVRRAPTKNVKG